MWKGAMGAIPQTALLKAAKTLVLWGPNYKALKGLLGSPKGGHQTQKKELNPTGGTVPRI